MALGLGHLPGASQNSKGVGKMKKKVDSHHSNGTGLGLAIAREIVLAHHGKIEVSSAPGVGTEFKVVLPTG